MSEVPHGEVQITLLDNNIIFAVLVGSFNATGAKLYTHGVKDLIATFNGQAFSMLIDNRRLDGGTPDAYQELEDYNQWLNRTAIVAKAIIVPNNATTVMIKTLAPSINQQNIRSFNDKQSAIDWLQEQCVIV